MLTSKIVWGGRPVRNFTPHDIRVRTVEDRPEDDLIIKSTGEARAIRSADEAKFRNVSMEWADVSHNRRMQYDIPVKAQRPYTGIVGLPIADTNGRTCDIIVSLVVAETMKLLGMTWPSTVLVPDTGPGSAIRVNGNIIGVRGFIRYDL